MSRLAVKLPVFVVGMEVCWLYAMGALFGMLFGHGGPPLSLPYVVLLMAMGYSAAYVLEHLELSVGALRAIGGGVAAFFIANVAALQVTGLPSFLGVSWMVTPPGGGTDLIFYRRVVMLALALGAVMWWRAVKLTQRRNTIDAAIYSFRLGLAIIAVEALVELVVVPKEAASWVAVPFFVLALWTFVLSRDYESGGGSQGSGLSVAGAAVGAIVIAGLIIGSLPYGLLGGTASRAGSLLDDFIYTALVVLLFPLGLLMEALVALVRALLSAVGRRDFDLLERLPESPLEAARKLTEEGSLIPPFVGVLIKVTIILIIVGLVLLWISRALRKQREGTNEEEREVRESLWGDGDILGDLKTLLAQAFTGPRERPGPPLWAMLVGDRRPRAAILRVYYSLLSLASSRGASRGLSQTPWEFLDNLYFLFPINRTESRLITESFTKARYSPREPDVEEASQVQAAWQQIQRPVLSNTEGPAGDESR